MQRNYASKRGILVSTTPYDTRIAVLDDGILTDLLVENSTSNHTLGNIYKGVVQRVVPALQAAFVEIGLEKAGFLHINDAIDRDVLLRKEYGEEDSQAAATPSIEKMMKAGDVIMVQVIKEPINTKGARLTMHLSFAERFLVCMPNSNFIGISKKQTEYVYVDDEKEYQNIREYLGGANPENLQKIKLWKGYESLFESFGIEDDYEKSLSTKVYLPRGAYLIIEQTGTRQRPKQGVFGNKFRCRKRNCKAAPFT